MSVMELGENQETSRLVLDAKEALGLPGAHGDSLDDLHSSVTLMVTVMVAVLQLESVARTSTCASGLGWVS